MTTSARPLPDFPFRFFPSFRLSTPVSRRFLFLLLHFPSLSLCSMHLSDTQLPVLPFCPPSVPPPSGFPNAPASSFDSSGFSPFTLPGFPCSPSGSAYSARCLFPFVLSCFAPTAVPQALTSASLGASVLPLALAFLSSDLRLGSDYSASVSSFPFFRFPPHSGFRRAIYPRSVPACFHAFLPDSVLGLAALPFFPEDSPHSGYSFR